MCSIKWARGHHAGQQRPPPLPSSTASLCPHRVDAELPRCFALHPSTCSCSSSPLSALSLTLCHGRAIAPATAAIPTAPNALAPHEHHHHLCIPLLYAMLMLTVQVHTGTTVVAGAATTRPLACVARPPRVVWGEAEALRRSAQARALPRPYRLPPEPPSQPEPRARRSPLFRSREGPRATIRQKGGT
jgi:hypothetical protein